MKITFISDTHTKHRKLKLEKTDMLIHAGDVSSRGYALEIEDFLKWFADQPHDHKIFIAGNHDFKFENEPENIDIPSNVIYLNDSGVTIDGIKIWGSPITPYFHNWAFNRHRGDEIKKHWDLIPDDVDILITHGPPDNILDMTIRNEKTGCKDLFEKVMQVKPKIHVFGHIHEAYGQYDFNGVRFINASILDIAYHVNNQPTIIDYDELIGNA